MLNIINICIYEYMTILNLLVISFKRIKIKNLINSNSNTETKILSATSAFYLSSSCLYILQLL